MRPAQAAKRIGCTIQHVRLLVRNGKLDAERIDLPTGMGYYWNIDPASVKRYIYETKDDGRSKMRRGYKPDKRKGK